MKLLLENTCFLPIVGGTETYCYQFLTNFDPKEVQIKLVCQYPLEGPGEINSHKILRFGGFDLKSGYHDDSNEIDSKVGMGRILYKKEDAIESSKRVMKTNLGNYYNAIFDFQPDVIFVNDLMRIFSSPYFQHFLYLTGAKMVVNIHGILTSFRDFWEIRKDRKRLLSELLSSDLPIHYIAPSQHVFDAAVDWGVPRERLHQIYLGVDTTVFTVPNAKEKAIARKRVALKFPKYDEINQNCFWISFPSRAVSHKGFDTALEALQIVAKKAPEFEWLMIIAGGSSDNPESVFNVQEIIRQYQLGDRILIGNDKFLDFPNDMKLLHQASDLCLFPSRREALGYGTLESMACGVPVIGTSIPGLSEVFDKPVGTEGTYEGGWVIKPEDEKGLANVLLEISAEPEMLKNKREPTRKWVEERFSIKEMIKKHKALFDKLVSP